MVEGKDKNKTRTEDEGPTRSLSYGRTVPFFPLPECVVPVRGAGLYTSSLFSEEGSLQSLNSTLTQLLSEGPLPSYTGGRVLFFYPSFTEETPKSLILVAKRL